MRIRRWACIALCAVMMGLTACVDTLPDSPVPDTDPTSSQQSTPDDPAQTPAVFTLAYSRADSLNPFTMTTRVNDELSALLYEGLTTLDASMHAQNALAADIQVTDGSMIATLRENAVFSDGSAVTAADVVVSFEAAKESQRYRELLRNITEARTDESNTRQITFVMKEADPYATACLSFPVIRTRENGTVLGSGPFVFENTPRLVANPQRPAGNITEIRLLDLVDDESLVQALEWGNVTYIFSNLADGEIPRHSSASAAVPMNCLVFLGVNSSSEGLENSEVRQALSLALDRDLLASAAFAGYAAPATTTFLPQFVEGETVTALAGQADREAAKSMLAGLGYATPDATTTTANRPTAKPETLSLRLLVNGDNGFKLAAAMLIKEQLEAVGVTVSVEQKTFSDYTTALRRGQYDLYIGEIRLTENMDLSPLLVRGGEAAYGLSSKSEASKSYAAFCEGSISLEEFTAAFASDLPYIPLCWRQGMAAYARELSDVSPTAYSVYAGLQNWQLSH